MIAPSGYVWHADLAASRCPVRAEPESAQADRPVDVRGGAPSPSFATPQKLNQNQPRKKLPPRATALDPYKSVIDGILRTDLDAPRKQWHTITRIFHRFVTRGPPACHRRAR
jgi:hypothetical protein